MRVALLSLTETISDQLAGGIARGLVPFGPCTIIDRQVEFALELGCERMICLAHGIEPGVIEVQRRAEAEGAQFHLIRSSRNLASLVKSADELLVLTDGLLPLCDQARAMLAEGCAVLALPVEAGLARGFERIDLNHAWAGAMLIPGALVERLLDLPEDADVASSLLRIALQARVKEKLLPEDLLADWRWTLIRSPQDAGAAEASWIRRQALGGDPFSPSAWIGGRLAARLGPSLMQRGIGSSAIAIGSILLVVAAVLVGGGVSAVAGLVMFVPALVALEIALAVKRLEGRTRHGKLPPLATMRRLFDAPLALLLAYGVGVEADWQEQFFALLMVLGLTALLPALNPGRSLRLVEDRCLLAFGAAVMAGASVLLPALRAYSLALLVAALFFAGVSNRITRA